MVYAASGSLASAKLGLMHVFSDSEIPVTTSPEPIRDLIFLVHRIPFPPDKGDKIRSFHLLEGLSRRYRVHLGAFVDQAEDRQHQDKVAQLCASTCFVSLDPRLARCRSAVGLLRGEPLTFAYYRSRRLTRWVKQVMDKNKVQALIAFSGCMAQYGIANPGLRRILDLVDVDSEKWNQYSQTMQVPLRWFYRREYRSLRQCEIRMAREFDRTVLVSKSEADLLRFDMGQEGLRVVEITNGVNTQYFDPSLSYPNPYSSPDAPVVVFTGAMDYRPNVDAILWFTRNVWPGIKIRCPKAQLWVVGSKPTTNVLALSRHADIFVTGRVIDVRAYLRYAKVAIAPLRIARGLQNKILEALAMELPVVATPQAWEGIDLTLPRNGGSTENAEAMTAKICVYLEGKCGPNLDGRRFVSERHDWAAVVNQFCRLAEGRPVDAATASVVGGVDG